MVTYFSLSEVLAISSGEDREAEKQPILPIPIGRSVNIGPTVEFGNPEVLFAIDVQEFGSTGISFADYDVASDGKSFIVIKPANPRHVNIILNWPAKLGR